MECDIISKEHTCHLEIISGILRVFPEGLAYGDPYIYSCCLKGISPTDCEIVGALRSPTLTEAHAIKTCLIKHGYHNLTISRFINNHIKVSTHALHS